jgi:hypothetical protein
MADKTETKVEHGIAQKETFEIVEKMDRPKAWPAPPPQPTTTTTGGDTGGKETANAGQTNQQGQKKD